MRILPVVKAYPVIDQVSFSEAVCVAGVTAEPPHEWVRLFPLDFRGLDFAQQFRKYEFVEVQAGRSRKDPRPETYTPVLDSVHLTGEHLGTDNGTWIRRLPYLEPLTDRSMCEIQAQQKMDGKSLGIFRPGEIVDLVVTAQEAGFAHKQQGILDQGSLFGGRTGDTRAKLEALPVKAKFHYRCDDAKCRTLHKQSFIDWELGALYRSLRDGGDPEPEIHRKIKEKFFEQMCSPKNDMRFIVGSMLSRPTSFLVLGLVTPKRLPLALF